MNVYPQKKLKMSLLESKIKRRTSPAAGIKEAAKDEVKPQKNEGK